MQEKSKLVNDLRRLRGHLDTYEPTLQVRSSLKAPPPPCLPRALREGITAMMVNIMMMTYPPRGLAVKLRAAVQAERHMTLWI